ncbi:MAG TPA: alpha/beta hydrolase [Candidatus Saccharimonadales bacterium]|nr:alpha/beta hydrolase [Candidatus Saccharimonadales bacterium]
MTSDNGRHITKFSVFNKDVELRVATTGHGKPIIFCPGVSFTQPDWRAITDKLTKDYQVFTFDVRGHGESSEADDYSLAAFLDDAQKVVRTILGQHVHQDKPLLVGYSLGADLAAHVAASRPDDFAALIIIDGANPLPAPTLDAAFLPAFCTMLEDPDTVKAMDEAKGTPHQVLLTPQNILALNLELDDFRQHLLGTYDKISCPITLLMSKSMAGTDAPYSARLNKLWHDGIARLQRHRPDVKVTWFDGDHTIVFTKAKEIAARIDSLYFTR